MEPNDRSPLPRRGIVGGAALGLAAAAVGPASAQGTPPAQPVTAQPLSDPTTKYPRPPYKKQSQSWPGLASQMEPKPDHGETSYRGSGRLAGRRALITGGDSGMGRAAAIAYAREGADVAINYLPAEEPDAREVIALIQRGRAEGCRHPRRSPRLKSSASKLVADAVGAISAGSTSSSTTQVGNRRRSRSRTSRPKQFDCDNEDQHLRAVLDHQGGAASPAAGRGHYWRPRRNRRTIRRKDLYDYAQTKAATMNLRKVARQAARAEGYPRQRRGTGPDLDAAAGVGRCNDGEAREVRRHDADGPCGAACRTGRDLRAACGR